MILRLFYTGIYIDMHTHKESEKEPRVYAVSLTVNIQEHSGLNPESRIGLNHVLKDEPALAGRLDQMTHFGPFPTSTIL